MFASVTLELLNSAANSFTAVAAWLALRAVKSLEGAARDLEHQRRRNQEDSLP